MKPLWKKTWIFMCVVLLCIAVFFVGCKKGNPLQSGSSTTDSESITTSSAEEESGSENMTTSSEEDESGSESITTSSEESESNSGDAQNSSSGGTWTGTYLPT